MDGNVSNIYKLDAKKRINLSKIDKFFKVSFWDCYSLVLYLKESVTLLLDFLSKATTGELAC